MGEKAINNTFVDIKVVPQIKIVINASKCPVISFFLSMMLLSMEKSAIGIFKNIHILTGRQAYKLFKEV